MTEVDLTQLVVEREGSTTDFSVKRNFVSRYLIPALIVSGFTALLLWTAWDILISPTSVKVTPVISADYSVGQEGTHLFNAAGWIEPGPTAIRVAALAPGVVEKLLVVEDQQVCEGEVVAELVKEDARLAFKGAVAERKLAKAELAKAKATLAAAKIRIEQPVHLEAQLADAEVSLAKVLTSLKNLAFETERAKSRLNLATRNHKRNVDAGLAFSQKELDESLTELETAQAMVRELTERNSSLLKERSALAALQKALQTQLKLLTDEMQARDEASAIVDAARARVSKRIVAESEARLRLSRMTVRAPVSGRIYQLVGLPGSSVGMGVMTTMEKHDGSTIVTMYQPQSLQVRVDVRFEDIPRVSVDQAVLINNPALESPITGRVLFVSSEADIQKNTLQVKVMVDNPPDLFKPEMLVDATFIAPRASGKGTSNASRIFINRSHVVSSDSGDFTWIADQSEGRAIKRTVKLGVVNGPLVEILQGLRPGDRIITTNTESLRHQARIHVAGEDDSKQ